MPSVTIYGIPKDGNKRGLDQLKFNIQQMVGGHGLELDPKKVSVLFSQDVYEAGKGVIIFVRGIFGKPKEVLQYTISVIGKEVRKNYFPNAEVIINAEDHQQYLWPPKI